MRAAVFAKVEVVARLLLAQRLPVRELLRPSRDAVATIRPQAGAVARLGDAEDGGPVDRAGDCGAGELGGGSVRNFDR